MNRVLGDMSEERGVQMAAMEPGRLMAAIPDIGMSIYGNHLVRLPVPARRQ